MYHIYSGPISRLTSCVTDTFTCSNGTTCIPEYMVCDGQQECADGSDEDAVFCDKYISTTTSTTETTTMTYVSTSANTISDGKYVKTFCNWITGHYSSLYHISDCGGLLEGVQGEFASPNYPRNYQNDLNCEWVIRWVQKKLFPIAQT